MRQLLIWSWGMSSPFQQFNLQEIVNWEGFPGGSAVKNAPAMSGNTGDAGFIPGSRRSPGTGHDNPLQYSCLENPTDRGAWAIVHKIRVRHNWSNWACMHAHQLGGEERAKGFLGESTTWANAWSNEKESGLRERWGSWNGWWRYMRGKLEGEVGDYSRPCAPGYRDVWFFFFFFLSGGEEEGGARRGACHVEECSQWRLFLFHLAPGISHSL